jgi:hypothetical protein
MRGVVRTQVVAPCRSVNTGTRVRVALLGWLSLCLEPRSFSPGQLLKGGRLVVIGVYHQRLPCVRAVDGKAAVLTHDPRRRRQ